ncbi:MAG TPA: hypothetical protein PLY40_04495, partial [Bacillota bacterium]|nr:hypothetical protein [Bacillota bacterium]
MRYLGKKSVASFLRRLLDVAWYLAIGGSILLAGSIVFSWLKMPEIASGQESLVIETPGLDFILHDGLQGAFAPAHFLFQFILILPLLAAGLIVIYNLRRIFATLVQEKPFQVENIRRIRLIGIVVIAGTVLSGILHTLIGFYLVNLINLPGLELKANVSLNFSDLFL